jgi:hypothetical protein
LIVSVQNRTKTSVSSSGVLGLKGVPNFVADEIGFSHQLGKKSKQFLIKALPEAFACGYQALAGLSRNAFRNRSNG